MLGGASRHLSVIGALLIAAVVLVVVQRQHRSRHSELVALGERLYREQSCVVCHGPSGQGNGSRAQALNPPPRDFRAQDAYLQGTTAQDIAETLKNGVRVRPSQMPSFSHLSERERLALGEFIVSLQRHDSRGAAP